MGMPDPEAIRTRIGYFHDAAPLRVPAFKVIDQVQTEDADVQLLGVATALYAMCEALGLDPHDLLQKIARAKNHIDGPFTTHYAAIREYAKGELTQ